MDKISHLNSPVNLKNPHLKEMDNDFLFHLGLSTDGDDLEGLFGDVKFVCMGGSTSRIRNFAKFMQNELQTYLPLDEAPPEPKNLSRSDRYVLYKVGPVLAANHGVGVPSLMVILHEILKLLHHARAVGVHFFRIGTSGGLGLAPGTVVITKAAMNPLLEPYHEQIILGKTVKYSTSLDEQLREQLMECSDDVPVAVGNTMCTNDFYEGQGRLDGAFCEYSLAEKLEYLNKAHENGVKNIEMESSCFAAVCKRANVPAAVLCVTLLDRLHGDQLRLTAEEHEDFQHRPQRIVANFIKKHLKMLNEQEINEERPKKRQKAL